MSELESAGDSSVELICPYCGYNLAAIESVRCPECGNLIDRSTLGRSVLPWLHRQHLGWFRAFWQTVKLASFQTHRFAPEMNCPARLADAIRFRWIVTLHVLIPCGVALVVAWLNVVGQNGLWIGSDKLGSVLQIVSLPIGWLCMMIFFWGMTGAAGYFFHPPELSTVRQNRAIALSFYSCAPLAWLPLAWFLALAATIGCNILTRRGAPVIVIVALWIIISGLFLLSLIYLIRVPVLMLKSLTHCTAGRLMACGVLLPVIWIFWGILSLVALPAVWLVIVIMAITVWS